MQTGEDNRILFHCLRKEATLLNSIFVTNILTLNRAHGQIQHIASTNMLGCETEDSKMAFFYRSS